MEKILKSIKFPGLEDTYIIPEGGSGTIDIDLEGSNEGEINPVDADTLGGVPASDYITRNEIGDISGGSYDISIDMNGILEGSPSGVNADLLGGYSAEHYATVTSVNQQVKKAAPWNLLDNSDFTNPVNQRGATNYSGAVYGIDRWKSQSVRTVVMVNDGYIHIESNDSNDLTTFLTQWIEPVKLKDGTKYTFAVQMKDGLIHTVSAEVSVDMETAAKEVYANGELIAKLYLKYDSNVNLYGVTIESMLAVGIDIVNAALYEGEYTADNLPVYQPKGYGAEMLECQRYYYPFGYSIGGFSGYTYGTTLARCCIQLPSPMRINPTLTVSDISVIGVYPGSKPATAVTLSVSNDGKIAVLSFTTSDVTAADTCFIRLNGAGIVLNADL